MTDRPKLRFLHLSALAPRAVCMLALCAACVLPLLAGADDAPIPMPDSLTFAPDLEETDASPLSHEASPGEAGVPRAPFGERLITDSETWRQRGGVTRSHVILDYNRVDRLRIGWGYEVQDLASRWPRAGARLEYAFQRERVLYGAQIEQPIVDPERFAIGFSMVRRTDHNDLQQVPDVENSLALLFGRQDYRDYFEREGGGAYASVRMPGLTTFSLHVRNDKYRSLELDRGTRSFFQRSRDLRDNPAIDPGEARTISWRFEHRGYSHERLRAGFYHWVDLERAGHGRGGSFDYTRLLADVRGVFRLSPASTLAMRIAVGRGFEGEIPAQRTFVAGGVDGLRAHAFGKYRGNQLLLTQTEYTIGLWRLRSEFFQGGLHAIAFLDAGRAWQNDAHHWDIGRQHLAADGGVGLGTAEDNLRIYVAKNLQESDSDVVVSFRLKRPF